MREWGITDTGLVRTENQDAYAIRHLDGCTLAVVCDGMGGVSGGQIASRVAVDSFCRQIEANWKPDMPQNQLEQMLAYSVSAVNDDIRAEAKNHPGCERMGTTLVAALVCGDTLQVLNVGDSRAYHVSTAGIEQISHDHSVVENMVEKGELTPQEARRHPNRNLITRALGPEEQVRADHFSVSWSEGEFLLLCSDGLVNTVSDQELLFEIIHGGEPDDCLQRLLALAIRRGAPDNVTAVLLMHA
ncbi:MAG: Stp1/IreP family PP2C-type Ser/Thr phosphatase [Oscillospiraceae bacterium]|nr:Stp1/IreP family PP2C-type Ser/Thr phosphatase [Oscillospiraceae bacterium]